MKIQGDEIQTWQDIFDYHFDDIEIKEEESGLVFDQEASIATLYIGELNLNIKYNELDGNSLEDYCMIASTFLDKPLGTAVNTMLDHGAEVEV